MRIALLVALRESLHFKASTFAQLAVIAGLVAPLLVLLALERSVVTDLRAHLRSFPENLQLSPRQSVSRPVAWFKTVRQDPRVGFIALHPYENADFVALAGGAGDINLLATGPGDPWLEARLVPPETNEAIVTQALADSQGLSVGDRLIVQPACGEEVRRDVSLTVTGIIPRAFWLEQGALVNETFLVELYLCRMGYRSNLFLADGDRAPETMTFPRFRLYAASLQDLRPLAEKLQGEGIFVTGRFAAADLAESVSRSADGITRILTLAIAGGALIALCGMLLSDARRMRPALATLRIDGLSAMQSVLVIGLKAGLVGIAGICAGLTVFILLVAGLNGMLASHPLPFDTRVRLEAGELALACAGVFTLTCAAGAVAALSTVSISPMEDQNAD